MRSWRNFREAQAIPLKEGRWRIEDTGACHHENPPIRLECRRAVCNVERSRKIRPPSPAAGVRVIDGGVTSTTTICSRVEDGPVRSQNSRSHFERSMILAATMKSRIPELHNSTARARPRAGNRVVNFRVSAVGVVLKNVRIHCEHLFVGQQRPAFFVVDIEFS